VLNLHDTRPAPNEKVEYPVPRRIDPRATGKYSTALSCLRPQQVLQVHPTALAVNIQAGTGSGFPEALHAMGMGPAAHLGITSDKSPSR
jgi:hypothetical protein